ncbi:MAG: divergent polysaccharide deacetylase family protein [Rhizomicrobium sp.]
MIRVLPQRTLSACTFRTAEGAFWFVLVLSLILGWQGAATGLGLLGSVLPNGLLAAEASAKNSNGRVLMTLPNSDTDLSSPTAASPVAIHDVPSWLEANRQALVQASASAPVPADVPVASSVPYEEAHPPVMRSVPAVARPPLPGIPAIAIVIDDLGPDVARTKRALNLPSEVALSFLPYAKNTPDLAREAGASGHDVMVHLPMQAISGIDPGPNALTVAQSAAENVRRLDWALARVPGFIGVNNHMGSRFTMSREALAPVMQALQDRHVFFYDSVTSPRSRAASVARSYGLPSAGRDIFLDDTQTAAEVTAELAQLERVARVRGIALAIGHPHDVTLSILERWCANLKGFRLVRIREAIRMKTEHETGAIAQSDQPKDMSSR